ncbi:hypothetical protein FQZ97_953550 [compost metagenome]
MQDAAGACDGRGHVNVDVSHAQPDGCQHEGVGVRPLVVSDGDHVAATQSFGKQQCRERINPTAQFEVGVAAFGVAKRWPLSMAKQHLVKQVGQIVVVQGRGHAGKRTYRLMVKKG